MSFLGSLGHLGVRDWLKPHSKSLLGKKHEAEKWCDLKHRTVPQDKRLKGHDTLSNLTVP